MSKSLRYAHSSRSCRKCWCKQGEPAAKGNSRCPESEIATRQVLEKGNELHGRGGDGRRHGDDPVRGRLGQPAGGAPAAGRVRRQRGHERRGRPALRGHGQQQERLSRAHARDVRGVAGAHGGRRHVRTGRGVVAPEVLLGARHARAPRRAALRRAAAPAGERLAAFRLVARRATEASLELADELEATWHRRMIEDSGRWPDRRTSRYTSFFDATKKKDFTFIGEAGLNSNNFTPTCVVSEQRV